LVLALQWIAEEATAAATPATAPSPRRSRQLVAAFIAGCAVGALLLWALTRPGSPHAHSPTRLSLNLALPGAASLGSFVAISPDGRQLVFSVEVGGQRQLYLRPLDQLQPTPVPGTDGANFPFFSPDSRWLGFFANGQLKKIQLGAKEPVTLCPAPTGRGASWGSDDTILFTGRPGGGLSRIAAIGGVAQAVTTPGRGELSHQWPEFLPDAKHAVFTIVSETVRTEDNVLALLSLDSGQWRPLLKGSSLARYMADQLLVYRGPNGNVMATRFDRKRLEPTGAAIPVLEDAQATGLSVGDFSVSRSGTMAYLAGPRGTLRRKLIWVDRAGRETALDQAERAYMSVSLSSDGHRIAAQVVNEDENRSDIWLADQSGGRWTRLTHEENNYSPIWSPDGKRVVFGSNKCGLMCLYALPADGTGGLEQLTDGHDVRFVRPTGFSPDGSMIALMGVSGATAAPNVAPNIAILPRGGKPLPWLGSPFYTARGNFSPDGRWLAYESEESGRVEVYVRPYPGPGGALQVSTNGGSRPHWTLNGEVIWRQGHKLMAATVKTSGAASAGSPRELFEIPLADATEGWDVSPDGQRFLVIKPVDLNTPARQLVVVPDWVDELEARLRHTATPAP
jgi:serine/threonine-protein kinase